MTDIAAPIEAQALDWLIRVNSADFADWDAFDAWIQRDPAHQETYWRLAEADRAAIAELLASPPETTESVPVKLAPASRWHPWRWVAGGAGGLAAIAAGALLLLPSGGSPRMVIETEPGMHRSITLADGSQVDLNGATRISFDRASPRQLSLDRGEALFAVVHDATRPFTLEAGNATIRDIGTVFDVVREETGPVRLAVAEGKVAYASGGTERILASGETIEQRGGDLMPGRTRATTIGGWRRGRLVYDDAPVARVADDLARTTGRVVRLDPKLAARRFSGSIGSAGDPAVLIPHAAGLMALTATPEGTGWLLTTGHQPPL